MSTVTEIRSELDHRRNIETLSQIIADMDTGKIKITDIHQFVKTIERLKGLLYEMEQVNGFVRPQNPL
ncbi:MAG: hypothetical protein SCARUB_01682 [Candidatus Scalindua rubra]|uniref:Uncharacterized protein n=1 Tax=Candidatus Scalindua rubra TaxID=1872076 RepID=A0A1E3XE26_9BACT|nr:MAG: hypothetical protein SCARUB_01682 [Candidatus Scalindua rubra]